MYRYSVFERLSQNIVCVIELFLDHNDYLIFYGIITRLRIIFNSMSNVFWGDLFLLVFQIELDIVYQRYANY